MGAEHRLDRDLILLAGPIDGKLSPLSSLSNRLIDPFEGNRQFDWAI